MSEKPNSIYPTGSNLLELVTSGLYNTPLAIYREYLQNSLDAYETFEDYTGEFNVEIDVDPATSTIRIMDSGPGLGPDDAARALVPIACSGKNLGNSRGFRGVGRLSALAFADEVCFRTRSDEKEPVTIVAWRRPTAEESSSVLSIDELLKRIVVLEGRSGCDDPSHFFEVCIRGISRHSANPLLNKMAVKRYIAETGPVPFGKNFEFANEIESAVQLTSRNRNLIIRFSDSDEEVHRPHCSEVIVNGTKSSRYSDFDLFRVQNLAGTSYSAIGWIAHTGYLGAITGNREVRGIRARQGNMQIGGEDVFSHLFREDRFAKWCVGEVHVVDGNIRPNSTRDYFEKNVELKNLENHIRSVAEQISLRCRIESKVRSTSVDFKRIMKFAHETLELAQTKYLDNKVSDELVFYAAEAVQKSIKDCQKRMNGVVECEALTQSIANANNVLVKLRSFKRKSGRPPVSKEDQAWYGRLAKVQKDPENTRAIIEKMIELERVSALEVD